MSPEELRDKVEKQKVNMHSIRDYGMGIFMIGVAIFGMVSYKKGWHDFSKFPGDGMVYPLFGLFIVYGLFRAYRGYQKKY
jgi:hypothetical protein